jgi:Holliday junction resolvase-like predicted endonuclease
MKKAVSSWHIGVAAEAFAAAQFARLGFDVSVQYGANQPEYDLLVVRGDAMLKVSVKGSQDGSWGLTQSYLKKADYHGAIKLWLAKHGMKTVLCLVQFRNVKLRELPRFYLARPQEIAERMLATASGRGDTILYEKKTWTARAAGAGTVDEIPASWFLTQQRVETLLAEA